jgi:peptidoglycan/xylan/chitin deacetylase (PgdA/CDA1 family)
VCSELESQVCRRKALLRERRGRKRGACLVFWDYDTQWGIDRSRAPEPSAPDLGILEFENTERLLELHAEYKIPACFAVVGAAALPGEKPYHNPAQIRRIHESGHEVGSHAFRHEWLPGLSRAELHETLRKSKDALEQCIGFRVQSFVLPFNQPFDYPRALSFSRSERREAKSDRQDLGSVCDALRENGYRFCRVAYRSMSERILDRLRGRRMDQPVEPEMIRGLKCARLNTRGGFTEDAVTMLDRCAVEGGLAVVYGHPHSLRSGNTQDERHFLPFMRHLHGLAASGSIDLLLPRDIYDAD